MGAARCVLRASAAATLRRQRAAAVEDEYWTVPLQSAARGMRARRRTALLRKQRTKEAIAAAHPWKSHLVGSSPDKHVPRPAGLDVPADEASPARGEGGEAAAAEQRDGGGGGADGEGGRVGLSPNGAAMTWRSSSTAVAARKQTVGVVCRKRLGWRSCLGCPPGEAGLSKPWSLLGLGAARLL